MLKESVHIVEFGDFKDGAPCGRGIVLAGCKLVGHPQLFFQEKIHLHFPCKSVGPGLCEYGSKICMLFYFLTGLPCSPMLPFQSLSWIPVSKP